MRIRKIIGWSAVTVVIVVAVLLLVLLSLDVSVYRGPLQSGVGALLGRSVKLDGEMSLTPSLRPRIVVEDVHIANPEWASRPNFASADRLEFQVALLPLIWGDLRVLSLALDGADILLEGRPGGPNNWIFKEKKPEETRKLLDIKLMTARQSMIGYRLSADRVYRFAVTDAEAVLTKEEQVQIQGTGKYRDVSFTLSLLGGTPAEFMAAKPWPVKLTARAVGTTVNAEGIVTRPVEGEGFDLQVTVEGAQLGELAPLFDIAFPALGPFKLSGRVAEAAERYSVTELRGRLGKTDTLTPITVTNGRAFAPYGKPVELDIEGTYGNAPFTLELVGGSLTELAKLSNPWPIKGRAHAAGATLHLDGSVARPVDTKVFNLSVRLDGKQFSDLSALLDTKLPALGPYGLSARSVIRDRDLTMTALKGHLGSAKAPTRLAITRGKAAIPRGRPVSFDIAGMYADIPISASLVGGSLGELITPTQPWPVTLTARGVGATLNANGTVAEPKKAKGFDLQAKVKGERFDALEPLLGFPLPALGSYNLSGRVADGDGRYTITGLKGEIGKTDISGVLGLVTTGPRPHVTATLASTITDIARLISTDEQTGADGTSSGPLSLAIPQNTLRAFDADLNIEIERVTGGRITVRGLAMRAKLDNGRATLAPIQVSVPGLQIKGRLELDARGETPSVTLDASTDRLHVAEALKMFSDIDRLRGIATNTNISFAGKGKTLEALLQQSTFRLTVQSAEVDYLAKENGEFIPIKIFNGEVKADRGQALEMAIEGTIRDVPVSSRFMTASLANLVKDPKVWPVTVSASMPDAALDARGTLTWPIDGKDYDLTLSVNGTNLSGLDPLLKAELPPTGPYAVSGQFVNAGDKYRLSKLEIKVDRNHATGKLEIVTSGPRPKLIASLRADEFHIEDLTRALQKRKDQAPAKQDDGRLIPDVTIPVKALRSVDLELNLNVTVMLAGRTDLGDLSLKAKLENGRLLISPFKGSLSGGELSVKLDVDATEDTPVVRFRLTGQQVDYGTLLKVFEVTDLIESVLDADIDLTGRGTNLRSLFANANGSIVVVSGPSTIGHGGLGVWGADLLTGIVSVAAVALKTKEETKLNCMVWPFEVRNGVAQSKIILIDMRKTSVGGTGTVNLGTEELDLLLKPARKKASLFKVGPPVRVVGTLSKLDYRVEGKKRALGKLLLPFFNPAFLLVTAEAGTGEMNPCVAAIAGDDSAGEVPKERRSLLGGLLKKLKIHGPRPDAESGEGR
ncbi:MAG: AsmA family protein [Gammaproteobacteria bacterium]|nr:AsmA family protein [Gammaproteobacteria bacterium]